MGRVYVLLDSFLEHDTGNILAINIDNDFQRMTRKESCNHIEDKFKWPRDTFWNLESTQKIRVCSQMARNIMTVAEKQFNENKKKKTVKRTVKNKSNISKNIPFGGKVK